MYTAAYWKNVFEDAAVAAAAAALAHIPVDGLGSLAELETLGRAAGVAALVVVCKAFTPRDKKGRARFNKGAADEPAAAETTHAIGFQAEK